MDERLEQLRNASDDEELAGKLFKNQDEDTQTAAALCIQLEFLAGLDSPKEYADERMAYQVDRLSKTLGDASSRLPVMDELHAIESRWYGLGPLSAEETPALQQRFDQSIAEIVKQNI